MADTNQNFGLFAGDSLTVKITVSEDLTGFIVKWAASRLSRVGCFSSSPLIEKCSNDATLTIVDAVNGVIEFTLDGSDTDSLAPANYEHQLFIVDGFGNETTVTEGTMTINRRLNNTC